MQQPPRGGTWVGSTFVVTQFNGMEVFPSEWLHISRFFHVIPNFISHLLFTHDRSCLDMSEADGVDSGAICKRGFIHLQFAAKPEAPEAERHLGSRILE
ncbi:hypothetical protein V1477_011757 [Vespula maculifrons]|uniref:Uncharacterized protein n=1 Tax=Vespula maculifrons TaxID=7453 RepID=A0ABD2C039_VESMC